MFYSLIIAILSPMALSDIAVQRDRLFQRIQLFSCFLILVLVAGLRWKTANDWNAYINFYSFADDLSYFALAYELGFRALVQICKLLGLSYTGFLLVTALIQMIGFFYFFNRFRYPLALVLLFFTSYYLGYIGTIRQTMAISMCLIAFTYLLDRKSLGFYFWVLVAALFHISAVIFIAAAFIPKRQQPVIVYVLAVLVSVLLGKVVIPALVDFLASISQAGAFVQKLIDYSSTKSELLADQDKLSLLWYVKRILLVTVFYFIARFSRQRLYEYCFNIYFISFIIFLLFFEFIPMIALRGSEYFSIFELPLLAYAFLHWKDTKLRVLFFVVMLLVSGLRLYNSLFSYSPVLYLPYYSIFDKHAATRIMF